MHTKMAKECLLVVAVSASQVLLACGGRTPTPSYEDLGGFGGNAGTRDPVGGGARGGSSGSGTGGSGTTTGSGGSSTTTGVGGSTGTGGSGATGGSTGTGGSGARGGSTGTGGSGATGGTGTTGGSGGSGATGGSGTTGGSGGSGAIGGSGGSGAMGGSGGTGGVPGCIPGQSIACACTNGLVGAQICQPNGTYGPCVCQGDGGTWDQQQLARLRRGIVGRWAGVQTNPWTGPCQHTFTFEASGIYSAHSPGESCVVLYYGSNNDSPEKKYTLDDVKPGGEGMGQIGIYFGPGNTYPGEMRNVALSEDLQLLKFEVMYRTYGPMVFSLKRESF